MNVLDTLKLAVSSRYPIRILLGGSPCTYWSVAQKNNRETKPKGEGWELFLNYLIAKDKYNPDYFLYENNKSVSQNIKDQISEKLGVPLQYINSALVSGQNRDRFYAHNIPNVYPPKDRHISLIDILDDEDFCDYNGGELIRDKPDLKSKVDCMYMIGATNKQKSIGCRVYDLYGKSKTICANGGGGGAKTGLYLTKKGIKRLNQRGCEKLQTVPIGYTKSMKKEDAIKLLGNGWTVDVIVHILSNIPDIQNKPVEVLSMYDGMSCGQIALNRLGVNIKRYYATEIDMNAIKITMLNFPHTIQLGNAFKVRKPYWSLP